MPNTKYEKDAIKQAVSFICAAARTAPKARGIDNLVIDVLSGAKKTKVISKMRQIAKQYDRPIFARDADNLSKCDYAVLIGTKIAPIGLKVCGFCGYKNCEDMLKHNGTCAYNPLDLGIAIGSAVSKAMDLRIDNRVMYTIGFAAIKAGILPKQVKIAIGIPLSVTGKNIFFDRK